MPVAPREVPETIPEEELGSLRGCLVDGDLEQRSRERRVRRHALAISVVLQSAALTVLVLVPLFGKTERIAIKDFVPMLPYGHPSSHPGGNSKPGPAPPSKRGISYDLPGPRSRPTRPLPGGEGSMGPPELGPSGNDPNVGASCDWCGNAGDRSSGPRPPPPPTEIHQRPQVVRMTQLDPGMLLHRVEPVYPKLAKQIHKEGRVELRAIIGTDGTIQSLQVVSGDPLFLISAREAVQQWRYRPTVLNGQAVEVDTYVTVVYTMQH